jgi:hypothetical protein
MKSGCYKNVLRIMANRSNIIGSSVGIILRLSSVSRQPLNKLGTLGRFDLADRLVKPN